MVRVGRIVGLHRNERTADGGIDNAVQLVTTAWRGEIYRALASNQGIAVRPKPLARKTVWS